MRRAKGQVMGNGLEREIREWLDAERLTLDELAEQSLTRAFSELPPPLPGAGFAERVARASVRAPRASVVWRSRWLRTSVAAALVAAGLAIVALPVWWLVADPLARALGSPLAAAIPRTLLRILARAVAVWNLVGDLGAAARASLVTRPVQVLLLANVLVAVSSLVGLKRLLRAPEELMP